MNKGLGEVIGGVLLIGIGFVIGVLIAKYIVFPFYEGGMERGYYLGVYQRCMDTEPQRYTIAITNDSNLPEIRDFSPICLEIAREYQRRNDYELEHRGWQWPLE